MEFFVFSSFSAVFLCEDLQNIIGRSGELKQNTKTEMLFLHSVYDFGCVMKIFLQIKWQHDPNEWYG